MEQAGTIITGGIGDDIHVVGIRIIEHALRAAGFKVVSLGILTTQEEYVAAAIEVDADALLISSSNGHAQLEMKGLREKCVEAGLKDILIYLGGNLVVGKTDWQEVLRVFANLGLTRIYPPGTRPETAIADLCADLAARDSARAKGGDRS